MYSVARVCKTSGGAKGRGNGEQTRNGAMRLSDSSRRYIARSDLDDCVVPASTVSMLPPVVDPVQISFPESATARSSRETLGIRSRRKRERSSRTLRNCYRRLLPSNMLANASCNLKKRFENSKGSHDST